MSVSPEEIAAGHAVYTKRTLGDCQDFRVKAGFVTPT